MFTVFVHDFHRTSIRIWVAAGMRLSPETMREVEDALCGMDDCRCHLYPVVSEDGFMLYADGRVAETRRAAR